VVGAGLASGRIGLTASRWAAAATAGAPRQDRLEIAESSQPC
jgi:hypothetical protein